MRSVALKIVVLWFMARVLTRFIGGTFFNMSITSVFAYPYPYLAAFYAFLLTYVLLVMPLKKIENVINQFRAGSFEARIRMKRKDELGNISSAFDDLADRIQVMIHTERRMTSNLGHEIRTPLTRVMLYLDKLRDHEDMDATIDLIEIEIQELANVSNRILKLAQIERGEIKPSFDATDLNSFIISITQKMQAVATSHHCKVTFDPPAPVTVYTDKNLLEIALMNILDNAIHYTSQKSLIQVLVDLPAIPGGFFTVRIRDQGQGVPESDINRIFLPFERVETSRDRESGGTGLGLALCRSIVNNLGGQIEARNLHPGFEVCISLPSGSLSPV